MTWAFHNREFRLLCFLLLLLHHHCFADGNGENLSRGEEGNSVITHSNAVKIHRNGIAEEDETIFGAEKRRVYTGPNPLHNR